MTTYPTASVRGAYGERLQQSLNEGYLTLPEYADRLRVIWGADTREELDYQFRDLPEPMIPMAEGKIIVRIDRVRRKFTLRTFVFSLWYTLGYMTFSTAELTYTILGRHWVLLAFWAILLAFWLVMLSVAISIRLPRKIRC